MRSIFWALISWSWSRDTGFHKSSRLNGRPTTVHTMRVTSCQNANVFILQFVLQKFLQLITIKITALSLERHARSPKPSWWIFPVFYGSRATSRWWRETLCQLMRRHMGGYMRHTDTHALVQNKWTHARSGAGSAIQKHMVLWDRVETDWAILSDSTEGLNIVRSAAKLTSPHTHTHAVSPHPPLCCRFQWELHSCVFLQERRGNQIPVRLCSLYTHSIGSFLSVFTCLIMKITP